MKKQQERNSKSMHGLRRHLLQHVHDMHVWKVFLEQDREYESEDLHIVMEAELDGMAFPDQVVTLDTAITEENQKLAKLTKEREQEAKSVNVAKKKAPEKKGLNLATAQKEQKEAVKAVQPTTPVSPRLQVGGARAADAGKKK